MKNYLSGWKIFLRVVESLVLTGMAIQVIVLLVCKYQDEDINQLVIPLAFAFIFLLSAGLFSMMLLSEFVNAVRATIRKRIHAQSAAASEKLLIFFRWCPVWIFGIASASLMFVLIFGGGGEFYWEFGTPLTHIMALSISSTCISLSALILPIISSAARMPETYSANMSPQN